MSTRNAAYIAMTAVILCVCSWLTVPFTVPFTMQTFGVYCAFLILGGRRGLLAIGLYILLGLVGLPVFSGFRGGPGHLLGLTGGYIIGFLFTGLGYLLMEGKMRTMAWLPRVALLALDLIPCYLIGTLWFAAVSRLHGGETGFFSALSLCVLPYILPDLLKIVLAERVSARVRKHLPGEGHD